MAIGEVIGAQLIASGASAYGQQQTNQANANLNRENRDWNAWQAELNREFQQNMSGSAYTRAVADLKRAGINPMLAYMQGGASSPSGSTASSQAAEMENPYSDRGEFSNAVKSQISSGYEKQRVDKELKLADENIGLISQQKKTARAQEILNTNSAAKSKEETERARLENYIINLQMGATKEQAKAETLDWISKQKSPYIFMKNYVAPLSSTARDAAIGYGALRMGGKMAPQRTKFPTTTNMPY